MHSRLDGLTRGARLRSGAALGSIPLLVFVSTELRPVPELSADFPQSVIVSIEAGLRQRWEDERVLSRLATALGVTVEELGKDTDRWGKS